jgi:hypothetical protein
MKKHTYFYFSEIILLQILFNSELSYTLHNEKPVKSAFTL